MMKNLEASYTRQERQAHVNIEEKVATKRIRTDGTHHHGRLEESAYDPNE